MSQKKQPKSPCKHLLALFDFLYDNELGLYTTHATSENIWCKQCDKKYVVDVSAFAKSENDGNLTGISWYVV